MNAIIEYLKCCWKGVATIVGMLAIITTLVAFYSNLATSADLKQLKTEVTTEFQKSMDLDRNLQRLNNTSDNLTKLKIQQRQYPKDKEIAEELEALKAEKERLQQQIQKR